MHLLNSINVQKKAYRTFGFITLNFIWFATSNSIYKLVVCLSVHILNVYDGRLLPNLYQHKLRYVLIVDCG